MVHRRKITAEEYYSDPHLKRLLNVAFNKYRSYGSGRGKVKLVISSQEEAERLQVFFGPQIRGLLGPGDLLSVDMEVIEEELGKCFILTIRSVYKELHADRETGC